MRLQSVMMACAVLVAGASACADDIAPLSDEFDDPKTLAAWQRVDKVEKTGADQIRRAEIDRKAGRLVIEPFASVWYRDYRGVLLFKPVSGDFVATTSLAVQGKGAKGTAPRSQFSLAGLMVRAPREVTPQTWKPGGENYVFLSLGAADKSGTFSCEVKTTVNSDSKLEITPGTPEGEIRCARIGEALILLRKLQGEEWRVHRRYHRPDFPQTLQVGLTCYTDWPTCEKLEPQVHNRTVIRGGKPDLIAHVDYLRYARPIVPESLRGLNLADHGRVSDDQLLAFLGAAADPATPAEK